MSIQTVGNGLYFFVQFKKENFSFGFNSIQHFVSCKTFVFGSHFILVLLVVKEKNAKIKKKKKKITIKECKRRQTNWQKYIPYTHLKFDIGQYNVNLL